MEEEEEEEASDDGVGPPIGSRGRGVGGKPQMVFQGVTHTHTHIRKADGDSRGLSKRLGTRKVKSLA